MVKDQQGRKPQIITWEPAVLVVACLLPTVVTLAYFIGAASSATSIQQAIYGGAKLVQFALPIVWVGLVCRERLAWPRMSNLNGATIGLLFGMLVALATAGLYQMLLHYTNLLDGAIGPIRDKIIGLGLDSPTRFLLLGLFYSLVHSLLEEYYWRWFVFGRLKRLSSLLAAIGISSAAFTLHHVVVLWGYFSHAPALAITLAMAVATGGIVWAWIYHRGGSIYAVWWSHAMVDAAIFAVGYQIAVPVLGK